jgi:hypothetical protein
VLIPDVPNSYGDIYSREAIKEFAYLYAKEGYGIDVDHDNKDVRSLGVYVVEWFLARDGDPVFIPGSWVVAMKVEDDIIWGKVLNNEINGYSYQADVTMLPVEVQNLRNRVVVGQTAPDTFDGHVHDFMVVLDPLNRPVSGGTSTAGGHYHKIVSHTYTEVGAALLGLPHKHRYQVLTNGEPDA